MNVTVTVSTPTAADPGTVDPWGNPVPGLPLVTTIEGCVFDPGGGTSSDRDLTGVAAAGGPLRARVFCPLTGHRFDTTQTITMQSGDPLIDASLKDAEGNRLVWQVDGEPNPWRSPWSQWTPGVEVPLSDPRPWGAQ